MNTKQKSEANELTFGKRLAATRKNKGLSQSKLGQLVGVSQRVIAYYESETKYPPTHLLIPLAKALRISVDELLGLKETEIQKDENAALWRQLKKAEQLPQQDRKTITKMIEALIAKNKISK